MKLTRFEIAKTDIVSVFEEAPQKIFRKADIERTLSLHKRNWRLADSMTTLKFIALLLDDTQLREHRLKFPSRTEIRYTWGNVTSFEVALSLKQSCYFTHFTSVFLLGLTDQIPKTIYVNWEQPTKRFVDRELEQSRIDGAFKRKPRVSHNIAPLGDYRVCLLNGMHTSRLGVYDEVGPSGEAVVLTNLERTLIDITVRPFYAGGVFEVAGAFRAAKGKASVNKIQAYLKQLNYVYPYHQAVGFYLEKARYPEHSLELLQELPLEHDFYLTYAMEETAYSERWRIFFPKGM